MKFWVRHGQSRDAKEFKKILDRGKHPTFIGPDNIKAAARNGGICFAMVEDDVCAVALVNPRVSQLNVLNVVPNHRGHGIGKAFLAYLACNFARVVEDKVPFFKSCGYIPIGEMKQGRTLKTQIMVRENLLSLAGRVRKILGRDNEKPLV